MHKGVTNMKRTTKAAAVAAAAILTIGVIGAPARTQASSPQTPGVTSSSILVGCSLPQSGPAGAYGVIANGTKAYFNYVNAHGGVYGRKISYQILDDGYLPDRQLNNVKNLVLNKGVFALADDLGTANNEAALPFITREGVPLVYPATGSSAMTNPFHEYLFAMQVSYTIEGKVLTDYAVKTLHAKKIGVFYQNDDFGQEGLNAVTARAKQDGATVADSEPYELSQADLSAQALKLKSAGVDAVIMFAVPTPAITFMTTARTVGLSAKILSSDTALDPSIVKAAGPAAEGVYFDSYADLPSANTPNAVLLRSVVSKYGDPTTTPSNSTFVGAGLLSGEIFVEGLKRAGKNLTRQGFIRALETLHDYHPAGSNITYTPRNHAGIQGAYVVEVKNGVLTPVSGYEYP